MPFLGHAQGDGDARLEEGGVGCHVRRWNWRFIIGRERCRHGRCGGCFGCCCRVRGIVSIGAVGAVGIDRVCRVMTMVEGVVGRRWQRRRRRRRSWRSWRQRRCWRAWYLMLLLMLLLLELGGGQTANEPVTVRYRRWRRGGRVCVCVAALVASALGPVEDRRRRRGIKVAGGTVSRSPLLCGRLCSAAHE